MNRTFLSSAAPLSLALLLAGCTGHGQHTTEGITIAQERMATIKAGTEWDMARQQFLVGDLSKAIKSVNRSLEINDSVPKSHSLKGRILLELGQLEQALESFKKALAIDPTFVDAHYFLGVTHERFQDYETALGHFESASSLEPGDAQYVVAAAEMLIELGRLDRAQEMLGQSARMFEHNAGVRQTLGHIAMIRGDQERAVELFNEARLLAPDDLSTLEDLASAQMASDMFAEAEFSIRRLLDAPDNDDRPDLERLYARCLLQLNQPVDARSILMRLANDPRMTSDPQVWIDLGEVALTLDDLPRLRQAGMRAISLAPGRHEGHMLVSAWSEEMGDLAGALKSAQLASQASPESADPHILRGLILQKLGRSREASMAFAQAQAASPQDGRVRRLMAVVEDEPY